FTNWHHHRGCLTHSEMLQALGFPPPTTLTSLNQRSSRTPHGGYLPTPNAYMKEYEEIESLLGSSNQSRLSLHDVNFDNIERGRERGASSAGICPRSAAYWADFKKTRHGRILVLLTKTSALLLFILLVKTCTSKLWSNGHWEQRNVTSMPLPPPIRSQAQAMKISNFPTHYCASNRLDLVNTGMPQLENDTAQYWDWRYRAAGIPVKPHPTPEQLLNSLVNEGGWLMIGDSLSAQWFMSLSCYLAPYVYAVPHFTPDTPWNATQHLYLNNASALVRSMELPVGFDLNTTPLVSILRSGLLLSRTEVKEVIEKNNLIYDDKPMFGPERVYDMHTSEYTADFLDPKLRYSKMIASAGAHYTALLFQDRPFHQIAEIFHYNFERWAEIMTEVLKDPRSKGKKILYRTATAGHDKCNRERGGPWNEEKVLETPVWNWQTIPLFNKIADSVLTALKQPRLELMAIERPAMMRPDALNVPRTWNSTNNPNELEPAELEDASWSLSPPTPNSYMKEHEENKSLLGSSSQSRLSLHDVNLDNSECGREHTVSNSGICSRSAAYWADFKKTGHGKILVLLTKTSALLLFIFLVVKEIINLSSPESPNMTKVSTMTPSVEHSEQKTCTSKLWSNGHWEQRNVTSMPLPPPIRSQAQAMKISNFPTHYCSSNRLPLTNTGMPRLENDTAEYWDWRYRVSSYNWNSGCEAAGIPVKPHPTPEQLLNSLVNEGGWLMIGDSLSAQWFMSLSCYLAPYVYAVPHFTPDTPWNATQHLYLNNASSFVRSMELPVGFDLNTTPLICGRIPNSTTILYAFQEWPSTIKTEIQQVIEKNNLINDDKPIESFDMHTSEYTADFLNPKLRYSKMIASAGAHYTALLFQDRPFHQIAEIFHYNFERWAEIMTDVLKDPRSKGKKILYRTATAGHDKCNRERGGPWNEEKVLETPVWNWQTIPLFNKIADSVLTALNQPRLELMAIERPAMMRPDAHILIDCLHFTVGAGIIEGWTDFLYNYA
ncbi:hypothetical protein PSTT_15750, partial [Puccinia striiformis]